MKIENSKVLLQINSDGGAYFDFQFKDFAINPLNFHSDQSVKPLHMGHFVCFDRWGPPTDGEKANGFIHHGEANSQVWKTLSEPLAKDGFTVCSMMCSLPMGGLQLTRNIALSEDEPVFLYRRN